MERTTATAAHFRASALAGARACVPVALSVFAYGLVYGLLAGQAGMNTGEIALASGLVFAGASQFVALDMWSHPLPVAALAVMALAVNLRHVLMGAALHPWMANRGLRAYAAAFFIVDESWALTLGTLRTRQVDGLGFLVGSGAMLWAAWLGAGLAGGTLGAGVDPVAWGLDFAFTAVFLALLASLWRGRRDLAPWVAAALLAVAAEQLLPGKWYIVVGGLGGSLAAVFVRTPKSGAETGTNAETEAETGAGPKPDTQADSRGEDHASR